MKADNQLQTEGWPRRSRNSLLEQQRALASLTRSEIFSAEDALGAIRLLTRTTATELEIERVSVWRFTEDRSAIACMDLYELSQQRHSAGMTLRQEDFPSYFEGLEAGEAIVADDAHSHPFTADFSETYLRPFGIASMLDVPIHVFGHLEGVLCCEQTGAALSWSAEERFFAIAVANLAALVIEQNERKRAEALLRGQRDVLELIANGAPLERTLATLARTIEQQDDKILCSVLLLDKDGIHLRHGAAPSLPDDYSRQIDGIAIGPSVGSCGTAVFNRQTVIVSDIRTDPRWTAFRDLAEQYGLRACWSTPIFDSRQRVIGTFAIYYREPHPPIDKHSRLIEMAIHTAAIAIERSRVEDRIQRLAFYDALTGLPNRALFKDRAAQALALSARDKQETALLFLDLDRFKTVNDSLGHHVGDRLLQGIAGRLRSCLRDTDTVSRLGGDEFVVLLPETGTDTAAQTAERILGVVAQPYVIEDYRLIITPSIGISLYPQDGSDVETLVKHADTAMYHAKEQGRNTYQFFTGEMNSTVLERLTIESGLRQALERGEFLLEYQPQYDVRTHQLVGVEALIRWQHPEWGRVAPGRFIPIAEDSGLIVPIGEWVIREACRQNMYLQSLGFPKVPVAVNIASPQFLHRFEELVERILAETGMEPHYLELELTEGIVMQGEGSIQRRLHKLKELGVKLAIDDFGTGYSSLSYLKRFPIDKLKIDQSFVRDIIDDQDDLAITRAVISLGHSLRLTVIAEGVETEQQLAFLREEGCDQAQGFFFSRPLSAKALAELFLQSLEKT
ncbi:sensor domain-containing phosphodiesterase [Methylocaldum sp.]|uniref:sensor domain-containing phosphodiesterase n=1 Tax=Methylocaldum sp. TaxID=1969727 RepID=UPI002D38C9AE|nr:EAL domain-containing protein [Methylocaldum sp.]HYE34207.1 EAL domain-containing protein [Methylocaldum sp.]